MYLPLCYMDGGAWLAAVHRVAKSRTRLSDFTFTFHFSLSCIGEGNGNPLQCSCLENPRDGGAWWAAVYGVTQSRTRLKWLSSSSSVPMRGIEPRSCSSCLKSDYSSMSQIKSLGDGGSIWLNETFLFVYNSQMLCLILNWIPDMNKTTLEITLGILGKIFK